MPFEERHILFYLEEIYDILLDENDRIKKFLPFKLKTVTLLEVAHTSKIHTTLLEKRDLYSKVMQIPNDTPSTLFYGVQKKLLNEKEVGFYIPDDILVEILKDTCINRQISLPRGSERNVISDNLSVGLRIRLSGGSLAIED